MAVKHLLSSDRAMISSQKTETSVRRRYITGADKFNGTYVQSSEKVCTEDYVQSVIQRYLHETKVNNQ